MGSPTLHSFWTMMVTLGRVSNRNLDLSTEVVPTNKWKGQKPPHKLNPCHCIDFMALVRKVSLKKLDLPVKEFHGFDIALTSMITKAGQNYEEIHIIFDTCREDCIKSERREESKEMVSLVVISRKHNLLELLKALPTVCMVYTAWGKSPVANIAQGKVKCYIYHKTLSIYHTNQAAVLKVVYIILHLYYCMS